MVALLFCPPFPPLSRLVLALLAAVVTASAQPLRIEPPQLDFAPVGPGGASEATLRLHNAEEDEVVLLLAIAGAHFAAAADTLRLAPGARRDLAVRFAAPAPGDYEGVLSVRVKGFLGGKTFAVPLRARVARPRLALRPPAALDLGEVVVGAAAEGALALGNPGEVPVVVDSLYLVGTDSAFALAPAGPLRIEPGQEAEIAVRFAPGRGGVHRARLAVAAAGLDEAHLELKGRALAPRLAVSPLPEVGLDYEVVELGQTATRRITVLNRGDADLHVRAAQVEGSAFAAALPPLPAVLPPGERLQVAVSFQPRAEGLMRGRLLLQGDDPQAARVAIPLRGEGRIGPPQIEVLNGESIDFGRVPLGKKAREHLLLWNRGGSPYTVQVEVRQDEALEFGLGRRSALLQPGESGKIRLDFSPREIGLRRAVLDISTPAGQRQLRLQGVGQFLKLSPSMVDFGQVAVGESSTQIVEIANIGNADLTIDRIRSTHDDFTVYTQIDKNLLLPANSLRTLPVHIAFSPSARGPVSGALRLEGFWQEGTETLDILLNGTGVAAEIEINPTGVIDFGYVVLGERAERTLVATNAGDTTLQVEAHPQSSEARVEPARFALGPGESTRLEVYFTPQALGERLGRILLVSNDVKDKARPLKFKGRGVLENIDLARIARLVATRKERSDTLAVAWNNAPVVQKDGTKIDVVFALPDSLRRALIGREIAIEWTQLDANYDPKGSSRQTRVKIYDSSEGEVRAEGLNLRLLEKSNRRVRLKISTRSYPGAPPQSIAQVLEAGGWRWEFEAKPLLSFLTIRPGRDYEKADGTLVKGKTERLIGLPGIAFASWHNIDNPSVSGIHITAIGNVLEALSTENSLAVSLGLAISFYKDQFLFGFGWDVYDTRPRPKRRGSQDYIMTFKYSGLFK